LHREHPHLLRNNDNNGTKEKTKDKQEQLQGGGGKKPCEILRGGEEEEQQLQLGEDEEEEEEEQLQQQLHQQQEQQELPHDQCDLLRIPQGLLDWVILWDIYLKHVGDSVYRWDAYRSLYQGLSLFGKFAPLFHPPGQEPVLHTGLDFLRVFVFCGTLSGAAILNNIEFKPDFGYQKQQDFFRNIFGNELTSSELENFLEFAVSMRRLPVSGTFPNGQKIAVRFVAGDDDDKLPTAHTCMFAVDMPPYASQDQMLSKLRQAIRMGALPFAIS